MADLAIVYWRDAVAGREERPENIKRIWAVRSIGWVLRNDTEGILLAHSRNPDGTCDYLNISRDMVLKVTYLKEKKE